MHALPIDEDWIEKNTIFSINPNIWHDVIEFSKEPSMRDRTILVDTNYLTQVNQKDFAAMLLNSKYEDSLRSELKKQMARLFRGFMERKLDLVFSNFVMREFIGLAPKRSDLLETYKNNIIVITPKNNYEPCFFDLAAAINSCIAETGKSGDIKDTYSYVLACIAKVRYFVTEDPDVERVYQYFSHVREKEIEEQKREIRKISGMFKILSNVACNFPLNEVLSLLFHNIAEPLTIPVSIAKLEDSLPQVLDRCELVMWIYRSLQEIERSRKYVSSAVIGWDEEIVNRARDRINEIANAIGISSEGITEFSFQLKIVEEGDKWEAQATDGEIASGVSAELNKLHAIMYEEPSEHEYANWEEQFFAEESTKTFLVECKTCEFHFSIEAEYQGIEYAEEREMGTEACHQWSGTENCPKCGEELRVLHELWEYPEFFFNYENTECEGCELLHEQKTEQPSCTLDDFSQK